MPELGSTATDSLWKLDYVQASNQLQHSSAAVLGICLLKAKRESVFA